MAYDCDFITDYFNFWSAIVFERHNSCHTSTVDQIAPIRKTMDSQSYVPDLYDS